MRLRVSTLVAGLLLTTSAFAQCSLNGVWTGTISGTKVVNGVTTTDSGPAALTIFNATATGFNVTITTQTTSDQGPDTNSSTGMTSGNNIMFVYVEGGGGTVTVNLTVDSTCSTMAGTFSVVKAPNQTSSGTLSFTKSGATLSLGQVTFQSVIIGKVSGPKSLTLSNGSSSGLANGVGTHAGTASLSLGPPTTDGDFSVASTTCGTALAAGSSCSVSVTCNPTGPGVRTGTLYINDPNKSPIGSAPLTCSGVNPVPGASFFPQSGWWWDSSLSGTGFFIEYGGNSGGGMFIGGFLYDASGNDTWLVSTGQLTSGAKYTGTWLKATGGQTLTGAYKAPALTTVANIGLTFTDSTHATLTRPDGSQVNLARFSFSATATPTPPVGGAPQSGWWWAGNNSSGTGYGIEIQGNAVFVVAYVYDSNGNPVWYLATGALTSPNSYSGQWDLYAGGPQLTSPEGTYSAHTVAGQSVAMTLTFTDGADGTLTMGSVVIPITRFQTY